MAPIIRAWRSIGTGHAISAHHHERETALRNGPKVAELSGRINGTLGAARRAHIRTKGGEHFGSNGKWIPDSAAELLLDGASLAATSNSEEPRKLLAPRLLYYIAEAEDLSSVLNRCLSPTAGKNKKTSTGHD